MSEEIKILVTGDTHLGGGRVKKLAIENKIELLFGDFAKLIREADLSITNLESPCINIGEKLLKTGPNLKSPEDSLKILKNVGFDLVTLANNHILDYGATGLHSTLKLCNQLGIDTVGAGKNGEEAQRPIIYKIKGRKIAVINIAENEFGTTKGGCAGAHALNPVQNFYRIKEVKKVVYKLILIIHGGHEQYSLPSPRMKETYRFFADSGADIVIGHHPHCYSGYEVYKGTPIFYSIGNFLFDKGQTFNPGWNEGYLVELLFTGSELKYNIIPYVQNAEKPGLRTLKKDEHTLFEQKIMQLNEIISDNKKLQEKFEEFCESRKKQYSAYIEPHSISILHALRNRNLFPSLLNKKKKSLLLNLTRCESHRDILKKILE